MGAAPNIAGFAARLAHVGPAFSRLSLEPTCTKDQLDEAYRALAKMLHPDHGGDLESFLQLQSDYEELAEFLAEFGSRPAYLDGAIPREVDDGSSAPFLQVKLPQERSFRSYLAAGVAGIVLIAGIALFLSGPFGGGAGRRSNSAEMGAIHAGDVKSADFSGLETIDETAFRNALSQPGLTSLNLSHSQLSFNNLQAVRGAVSLRELDLSYSNVGDGLWAVLAKLPHLEVLNLDGVQRITTQRLAAWAKDQPGLKLVSINDTDHNRGDIVPLVEQGLFEWSPRKLAVETPTDAITQAASTSTETEVQPASAEAVIAKGLDSLGKAVYELDVEAERYRNRSRGATTQNERSEATASEGAPMWRILRNHAGFAPPRSIAAQSDLDLREIAKQGLAPRRSVRRRLPDPRDVHKSYLVQESEMQYSSVGGMRAALSDHRRALYGEEDDDASQNAYNSANNQYPWVGNYGLQPTPGGGVAPKDGLQPGLSTTPFLPNGSTYSGQSYSSPYLSGKSFSETNSLLPHRGRGP